VQENFVDYKYEKAVFTEEMKKEYKIIAPTMLPIHFAILEKIFLKHGYNIEILTNEEKSAIDTGVCYVHNDACYPAICVIGQILEAIQSGKYDTHKLAVLITQTGGGCRASNYISMLRKALARAGYEYIPILSLNIAGLEKQPGFKMDLPIIKELLNCVLYGDLLMCVRNQCIVREINKGETHELTSRWIDEIIKRTEKGQNYRQVLSTMREIVSDFARIERGPEVPRVGIVGEIYVKYAPLGNNKLEKFLRSEGAEPVVPGLLDFCYYCVHKNLLDNEFYGMRKLSKPLWKIADKYIADKKRDMVKIVTDAGFFITSPYEHLLELAEKHDIVGMGMKMGEGWLLASEMLELCDMGVKNIICTQPFGCLPNHIVGKGMMRPVKACYPDANIVAIDYDPGASRINQENRVKLMLANAK